MAQRRSLYLRNRRSSILELNLSQPPRASLILVDYFTNAEDIVKEKFIEISNQKRSLNSFLSSSHYFNPLYLLALTLLGCLSAVFGFILNFCIGKLQDLKFVITTTGLY